MIKGYLKSRQFAIAAGVAFVILAAGASAYAVSGSSFAIRSTRGCDPPAGAPAADAPVRDVISQDGRDRTMTWDYNASELHGGSAAVCTTVGDAKIHASPDALVHVIFHVHAASPEAVQATAARATLTADGTNARVFAWEETAGSTSLLFGGSSAQADLEVQFPPTGAYDIRAHTSVGDVSIDDIMLGDTVISSSVGDTHVLHDDVVGNVSFDSTVGDSTFEPASMASGNVTAESSTGDITLRMPTRVDIAYEAIADSSTGDVTVHLGDTELYESESHGPGGHVHARTKDFASKPTRIQLHVETSTGDVKIDTR